MYLDYLFAGMAITLIGQAVTRLILAWWGYRRVRKELLRNDREEG